MRNLNVVLKIIVVLVHREVVRVVRDEEKDVERLGVRVVLVVVEVEAGVMIVVRMGDDIEMKRWMEMMRGV